MRSNLALPAEDESRSVACEQCRVGKYSFYGPALTHSPQNIETLRLKVEKYRAGRPILRDGETSNLFGTLRSGWACRFKDLGDGRRQILGFLIPGDAVTLEKLQFGTHPLPFAVAAITDVTVCWFSLDKMTHLIHGRDELEKHSQELMHGYYFALTWRMASLGRRSAVSQIGVLLLQLVSRLRRRQMGQGDAFTIPLTQTHFADSLGLTTVHVNRIFRDLSRRGILEIGRGKLTVLDEKALRHVMESE